MGRSQSYYLDPSGERQGPSKGNYHVGSAGGWVICDQRGDAGGTGVERGLSLRWVFATISNSDLRFQDQVPPRKQSEDIRIQRHQRAEALPSAPGFRHRDDRHTVAVRRSSHDVRAASRLRRTEHRRVSLISTGEAAGDAGQAVDSSCAFCRGLRHDVHAAPFAFPTPPAEGDETLHPTNDCVTQRAPTPPLPQTGVE